MRALLDIHVLIALHDRDQVHHLRNVQSLGARTRASLRNTVTQRLQA